MFYNYNWIKNNNNSYKGKRNLFGMENEKTNYYSMTDLSGDVAYLEIMNNTFLQIGGDLKQIPSLLIENGKILEGPEGYMLEKISKRNIIELEKDGLVKLIDIPISNPDLSITQSKNPFRGGQGLY